MHEYTCDLQSEIRLLLDRFYHQFLCSQPETYSYTSSMTAPPTHSKPHGMRINQHNTRCYSKMNSVLFTVFRVPGPSLIILGISPLYNARYL